MSENGSVWTAKDITYLAIVGLVMIAAVFEWFLWLAAFLYCLAKVYQKAENNATKALAIVMMVVFSLLRAMFLPVMVVTLPLPAHITKYFPHSVVSWFQWFAFWTFSAVLTVPWLLCIYQLVTHSLGRAPLIRHILDEAAAPKIVIVMPCFKEVPDILLRTIDSIVGCDYPSACLHIFLSFDGDLEDELYLKTIGKLGIPLVRRSGFPVSIDVTYRNARVTVSRFPHGGKRHCQKKTFKLIEKVYDEYLRVNDNLFLLFIDSDCILDKVCIQNFMYEMELKPGSKRDKLAMTGVVTATTEKNSLITLLQDMEYIHGQLFERSVESGCGAVTCLPGALTILRFSAFRRLSKYYFADKGEQCEDLFDYGKCHLGEDRWLTHLFMVAAKYGQIGMSTGAFCKTEAVQTFTSLLKQRRRWFLGFITNEVCMLTDERLWFRYPILCIVRLAQNTIRTTALLFFVLVVSLCTTSQRVDDLPVGFIAVSLGLNWILMIYFATLLGRYKILLYPVLFIVGPFLNWAYMVYAIFTAGQRTWGGPRADAGQADSITSPQAAIEHAEATGDDLNIIPETFRSRTEARGVRRLPHVFLQPPSTNHIPIQAREEFYSQCNEPNINEAWLGVSFHQHSIQSVPIVPSQLRQSLDSSTSTLSSELVILPRRTKSFITLETGQVTNEYRTSSPSEGDILGNYRNSIPTTSDASTSESVPQQSRASSSSNESIDLANIRYEPLLKGVYNCADCIQLTDLRSLKAQESGSIAISPESSRLTRQVDH